MHEVAATTLVSELRVGFSAHGLCLRLAGAQLLNLASAGAVSFALVLAGSEVRVLRIDRAAAGHDSIEIEVPFAQIGTPPGADFQFAIQVRDSAETILETVPHGRFWTIAVPRVGSSSTDWQA